jgi:hypothetical protein
MHELRHNLFAGMADSGRPPFRQYFTQPECPAARRCLRACRTIHNGKNKEKRHIKKQAGLASRQTRCFASN